MGRDPEPRFTAFQKVGSLLNPGLKMTFIRFDFDPGFRVDWARISRMSAGPAINNPFLESSFSNKSRQCAREVNDNKKNVKQG